MLGYIQHCGLFINHHFNILFYFDVNSLILNHIKIFILWILGQLSIVQFWTPDFLKFFGEGSPNASLWSICVELQFYFFVPILFYLLKRLSKYKFWIIISFFIASILFNHWIYSLEKHDLIYKLGFVSLFHYLFYFLFGVLFYNYWIVIKKFIEQKFLIWISLFLTLHFLCKDVVDIDLNNYYLYSFYKVIFILLLNLSILSFAYSHTNLADRILRRQDISYGIYIYHMIVINAFIQSELDVKSNFVIILILTVSLAAFSWFVVEKPILNKLKKSKAVVK
ncbi:acyltransferase family protein [Riemerella columbina]|uniref:acyltransferase family protein n=1 Tax=Riemerella columbina TaxID=103810 RepID=UPI0003A961FB|nr:acyltransferase family protein [Riemerella columbina]